MTLFFDFIFDIFYIITFYILHFTFYILHFTFYILHFTFYILHLHPYRCGAGTVDVEESGVTLNWIGSVFGNHLWTENQPTSNVEFLAVGMTLFFDSDRMVRTFLS